MGTAAELIKVWPVLQDLDARGVPWRAWSTGQSGVSLAAQWADLGLPQHCWHALMPSNHDLGSAVQAATWLTRAVVAAAHGRARHRQTRMILVHGDTLSAALGAVVAAGLGVPLAHLEAGLTSGTLWEPFPEELCRRAVTAAASVLFAPGQPQARTLAQRGARGSVVVTGGNTLADSVQRALALPQRGAVPVPPYCVVNLHRFENLNSRKRLQHVMGTVLTAAQRLPVVMVMHQQTATQLRKHPDLENRLDHAGVQRVPRLPFTRFLALLGGAQFLISDGGSNQEECSYLGLPCLLLRQHTERLEGLGRNCVLSGLDPEVEADFLARPDAWRLPQCWPTISPSGIVAAELQRRLMC